MRGLDAITDSMDISLSKPLETVKDQEAWHAAIHGVSKSRTWLSDWKTIIYEGKQNNPNGPNRGKNYQGPKKIISIGSTNIYYEMLSEKCKSK